MDGEVKPWKCSGGHVLGQVARNGRGVRQLLLYREAVDVEKSPVPPQTADSAAADGGQSSVISEVEVMAVVEGLVIDVVCSICGRPRTWAPGEEAIRRLLNGRVKSQ